MLIALLSKSQLVPMIVSFAGMLGFAGVAVWLWLRQKRQPPAPARRSSGASVRAPSSAAPSAQAPAPPAVEVPEPTEFVPLPNLREDDSPEPQRRAREAVAAVGASEPVEEEVERTEFIAAPLDLTGRSRRIDPAPEPEDRTAFVAPFGMDGEQPGAGDRTSFVAPPEPALDERTSFVAPPEPAVDERTSFVAPPEPAVEARTPFVAPPEPPVDERTSFVAPPEPVVEARTPFVAPPEPAVEARTPFVAPPEPAGMIRPPRPAPSYVAPAATPEPAPASTSEREAEFREHFELAVAASAQLEAGDARQSTILDGHLELLASSPAEVLLAQVRPLLDAPESPAAAAAWRLLFAHKTWPARRALPELLAELGPDARAEGLRSLASWNDPRAESLAAAGLQHGTSRPEWLELFASRGWDPGDATIEQALASSDPAELVAGLRLAGTRPPDRFRAALTAQLFASDPRVRIEAIEAALVFGEQSAWLVCRQLARNPAFPRAAELVGLLGSRAEIAALAQVASAAASAPLLWGLGLSGRPVGLAACVAAFDDDELGPAAREALSLASGTSFESAGGARAWVDGQSAERLIAGGPRTLEALAQTLLRSESLALRHAIAREIRIRTAGDTVLTPMLRPQAWRTQVAKLGRLTINLDAEFPWTSEARV